MKKLFAILCAVLMAGAATAQPPQGPPPGGPNGGPKDGPQGKGPNRTVEMLIHQLKMTPAGAEKFEPIYQSMQREMRTVRKELKMVTDHYKQKELDIKTAVKIMNAQLNADKEIIKIKKEYIKVFQKYLTPEQLSKVFVIKPRSRRPQGGPKGGPHGGPQGKGPQGKGPQGAPQPPVKK